MQNIRNESGKESNLFLNHQKKNKTQLNSFKCHTTHRNIKRKERKMKLERIQVYSMRHNIVKYVQRIFSQAYLHF